MARHGTRPLVIKGQSAVIETYPPVLGVPSSCTARFGTPSTAMPSSATGITPDSTSTFVEGDTAQGATQIVIASLDATTSNRRYLIGLGVGGVIVETPENQPLLDIETYPHDAEDSITVDLTEPLPCAVPDNAAVFGWRMSVDLTSNDTATIGPGVVEWTATIAGVVHKWSTQFRVVERDGTYTLSASTLTSSSPYCRDNQPDNDTDFTETIDAAWRRFVEPDLLGKALRPERIVHGPHFEAVHIAACEYFLALEYEDDPQKRAERKSLLATAIEKVLAASDLWITSEVEDLTNADPNALGLSGNAAGTMPVGLYTDGTYVSGVSDLDVCFITR